MRTVISSRWLNEFSPGFSQNAGIRIQGDEVMPTGTRGSGEVFRTIRNSLKFSKNYSSDRRLAELRHDMRRFVLASERIGYKARMGAKLLLDQRRNIEAVQHSLQHSGNALRTDVVGVMNRAIDNWRLVLSDAKGPKPEQERIRQKIKEYETGVNRLAHDHQASLVSIGKEMMEDAFLANQLALEHWLPPEIVKRVLLHSAELENRAPQILKKKRKVTEA